MIKAFNNRSIWTFCLPPFAFFFFFPYKNFGTITFGWDACYLTLSTLCDNPQGISPRFPQTTELIKETLKDKQPCLAFGAGRRLDVNIIYRIELDKVTNGRLTCFPPS